MFKKISKLTTVLFVLIMFLALPTSLLFGIDNKKCNPHTVIRIGAVCSAQTPFGQNVCMGHRYRITATHGQCNIPAYGWECNTRLINIPLGVQPCIWQVVGNQGFCTEVPNALIPQGVIECSHRQKP